MNKKRFSLLAALLICLGLILAAVPAFADSPTDEILHYDITVSVNDDATLNIVYSIDWLVLESDGIGPLSWVEIGIPNNKYASMQALSDTIKNIDLSVQGAETYAKITLDREYYEGEVAHFEYAVLGVDNLYSMNDLKDGYTAFYFMPGWFSEIKVDDLTINWESDKAEDWSAHSKVENGYLVWTTSLEPNNTFEVFVEYPNDAFQFDESKVYYQGSDNYDYDYGYDDSDDGLAAAVGGLFALLFNGGIIWFIISKIRKAYKKTAGFGEGEQAATTTVKRTKIVYFDFCPGCGAPHEEGARTCPYCGRDMVKSEEVITEDAKGADKEALKYKKAGEYHYSSDPNTYVRVVPVVIPSSSSRSSSSFSSRSSGSRVSSSSSRSSSSHHSSCAHSSCACASCACACACACAGGGRAGCSTKDFYDTNLKLKQLELKAKK